jgi:hypothetical protein
VPAEPLLSGSPELPAVNRLGRVINSAKPDGRYWAGPDGERTEREDDHDGFGERAGLAQLTWL